MANKCDVCGKRPTAGKNVSHAHNVTTRIFKPNLSSIRINENGTKKKIKICSKCLKTRSKN